ncbi:hypothetical protein GOBAR_AA01047 [Gossypium barbadense]|uniref:Uncharacterized protein n=1 Tax=Gossypium barbadense TaxID=3634 RepID=A0A2P5YVA1_GOSBA|nr:hypothetical protein GOBAR_AA01047 [Gossypium barbadense]
MAPLSNSFAPYQTPFLATDYPVLESTRESNNSQNLDNEIPNVFLRYIHEPTPEPVANYPQVPSIKALWLLEIRLRRHLIEAWKNLVGYASRLGALFPFIENMVDL